MVGRYVMFNGVEAMQVVAAINHGVEQTTSALLSLVRINILADIGIGGTIDQPLPKQSGRADAGARVYGCGYSGGSRRRSG